ncbi:hypothetical protein GGR51DRAFT_502295 [Nemania sp. FL0031]|nr:hypothetical protein GGR51DRAFT_502295 [Nemania sp. FL0031]
MPGWTQGENFQLEFSRTARPRKTIKKLKGNEDLPIRTTARRTNINLDQAYATEQRFKAKRQEERRTERLAREEAKRNNQEYVAPIKPELSHSYADDLPRPNIAEKDAYAPKFKWTALQNEARDAIKDQVADYLNKTLQVEQIRSSDLRKGIPVTASSDALRPSRSRVPRHRRRGNDSRPHLPSPHIDEVCRQVRTSWACEDIWRMPGLQHVSQSMASLAHTSRMRALGIVPEQRMVIKALNAVIPASGYVSCGNVPRHLELVLHKCIVQAFRAFNKRCYKKSRRGRFRVVSPSRQSGHEP